MHYLLFRASFQVLAGMGGCMGREKTLKQGSYVFNAKHNSLIVDELAAMEVLNVPRRLK